MDEFKRIQMSLFLVLLLQSTGAAIGQRPLSLSVRAGDEATLPCNYVIHDQDKCNGTSWFFTDPRIAVALVSGGQIFKEAKAKSDRLRVTEKCALVIKKVTEEDAGGYICTDQFRLGEQQDSGSGVYLSVVTMTEHQDNDEVTLCCSVATYGRCRHRAKWLLQGRDVGKDHRYITEEDHREIKTSQSSCSASVTFLSNTTRSELFTCEVTDVFTGEVQVFPFRPQSSGEDTAAAATESDSRSGSPTTASVITEYSRGWWWWIIIVVIVDVAALTIIAVAVIRRKRTQGQKPQTDENIVRYGVDDGTVNYDNIRPPDGV
ncbi:uncharacterized protein [Pseudochaenichthys georgianus]|uniref:uncharacterized protein n=1 Tax=Pseudochaenichthys georgianus TaxID=52239 RepID=UPI00146C1393|nr:uncharacterized protein LOC117440288 [Pseudochaenichthys georgianus]